MTSPGTINEDVLVNAMTFFIENTRNCRKTKIIKLLYHFDFIHYKQTGFSATGLQYEAWDNGPVPPNIFSQIYPNSFARASLVRDHFTIAVADDRYGFDITPRGQINTDAFTDRQLQILQTLAAEYRDSDMEEMVESTHLPNQPWHKTFREKGPSEIIDYNLALDGSPDSLPAEVVRERQAEAKEVHDFFGQ